MQDPLARLVLIVHEFIGGGRQLGETLTEIAELGVVALKSDMAGLTLHDATGRPRTVAYTDRMVPEMDEAQYDADRGPCLDAARDCTIRFMDGSDSDQRWPEFVTAAARHGIHSTLSLPVVVGGSGIGALNFYDARPTYFDEAMAARGQAFAGQSAIVAAYLEKADTADQLAEAMATRATIEQAKGVIMATVGCTPDRAFELLKQHSQDQNVKLREIAQDLVRSQERPAS